MTNDLDASQFGSDPLGVPGAATLHRVKLLDDATCLER
jgi:hypothetical protein